MSWNGVGSMDNGSFPIGVHSFRKIREEGHYYVDKTGFANRLIRKGKHYFLSRPRRFGKSMFVSMLQELFEGNRSLFEGLAIHDGWDWSTKHPVIRLDFNGEEFEVPGHLEEHAIGQIKDAEQGNEIDPPEKDVRAPRRLSNLIRALHKKTGKRAVILVDEYDKPILDALDMPKIARANFKNLCGLYSTIKLREDEIKFSFFTGVTKLSREGKSLIPNSLRDITINPNYSAICGYTESDLDCVFASELDGLDRGKIREWYNGYNWLGEEKVYSPYDILYLLKRRKFKPWWFDSGDSEFLIRNLRKHDLMPVTLSKMQDRRSMLESFDINNIAPEAMLFQFGYQTIAEAIKIAGLKKYKMDYPNHIVRQCLNVQLQKE